MTNLIHFDTAKRELQLATEIDEVQHLKDKADAMRVYLRQQKDSAEMQRQCAILSLRCSRRLGEMIPEKRRAGELAPARGNNILPSTVEGKMPTLNDYDISHKQSFRYQQIASIPESDFEQILSKPEPTQADALRKAQRIKAASKPPPPPPPQNKYNVIYIDPPWQYSNSGFTQSAEAHYPTMHKHQLRDFRPTISALAHRDCVMYMWATSPLLDEAIDLLRVWGFTYKACMIWSKNRAPGMGWWVKTHHEILLIGIRGNMMPAIKHKSVVFSEVGRHSKKPHMFYELIESAFPEKKYIEVFARNTRDGWDSWGNEPNV